MDMEPPHSYLCLTKIFAYFVYQFLGKSKFGVLSEKVFFNTKFKIWIQFHICGNSASFVKLVNPIQNDKHSVNSLGSYFKK
jgi:hypothetical protein